MQTFDWSVGVMDRPLSRREFFKTKTPKKVREGILCGVYSAYLSAVVTGVFAVLTNPFMMVDALFVLGLSLGIHLSQSRTCGVILTVYFVSSKIKMMIEGTGGINTIAIMFIIAFGTATFYTFQFQKQWKEYRQEAFSPPPREA